jgi:lipid-A-disaccharide synthase
LHARIVSPAGEVGELAREILNGFSELKGKVEVFSNDKVASGSVVLTSSGTMSLACALAGIPGAIVYLAHPMTYLLGRFLVMVPYLGMANLLLPKSPPYPEFIQRAARADALAKRLETCIDDNEEAKKAMKASTSLRRLLSQPADVSSSVWLLQEGGFEEKSS